MQQKMTFAGVAALALVAAMTIPGHAAVLHRPHHRVVHQSSQSTPAERQQTADLNRQQLAQAEIPAGGGSMGTNMGSTRTGTANQQNGLTTEPTDYQRSGTNRTGALDVSASAPGNTGSQHDAESDTAQTPGNASPTDAIPESNPDETSTPPVNPSGSTQ